MNLIDRLISEINYFIGYVSKLSNKKLKKKFLCLIESWDKAIKYYHYLESELGLYEFERVKQREIIAKYKRVLSLLGIEQNIESIDEDILLKLHKLRKDKHYTARSLLDTISKIEETDLLMKICFPKNKKRPVDLDQLDRGVEYLNEELCKKFKKIN